jgi:hypothetical protein
MGATLFPAETYLVPLEQVDRGGHFAAFEEPDVFATEIWTAFRQFRATPLADRGGDRRLT